MSAVLRLTAAALLTRSFAKDAELGRTCSCRPVMGVSSSRHMLSSASQYGCCGLGLYIVSLRSKGLLNAGYDVENATAAT